jgi:PleD family two-component response regulator
MCAASGLVLEYSQAGITSARIGGVLAICPHAKDRARLHEILRPHDVELYEATTWQDGAEVLSRCGPQVVICEAILPDANWRDVLEQTALLKDSPRLIVISSQADEFLWAEVLNLGGYDVLPKPLERDEVARVVTLAWQNWKNEWDRLGMRSGPLSEGRNGK